MNTAVITTGGLGTRLLTCTKINPKTMLPLYHASSSQSFEPVLRPLIETIFENLYDAGFRRFCFIINASTGSSIKKHLMPNENYVELLKQRKVSSDLRFIRVLQRLSKKISNCEIKWISQDTPMGFGDALLKSKKFVGNSTFLLHAGDAYFPNNSFLKEILLSYSKSKSDCMMLLKKMKSLKGFGIAQTRKINGVDNVFDVEEKPKKPKSNNAILPVYVFSPKIFFALKNIDIGYNGELQVTDAIQFLIKSNKKVTGFNLKSIPWFDIGTPTNYFKALSYSFKQSINQ